MLRRRLLEESEEEEEDDDDEDDERRMRMDSTRFALSLSRLRGEEDE